MKNVNRKKLLLGILIVPISIIMGIVILNISVIYRLNTLEKEVELQKKQLNRNVAERVTEIIHDPVYLAGGDNEIETETLINTKQLLSSEQINKLRNDIVKELQTYISNDVYLGVKELLIEELETEIREIVIENTNEIFSSEQQELLASAIQREVLNNVSSSIKDVSEELVSTNEIVKMLETNVTSLKKRVETLEDTMEISVSELENKDKELEAAINQLRISFVSTHVGTSDLSILSVQMSTNMDILSECENALKNNTTCYSELDKNTYLSAVSVYREQVEVLDGKIKKALEEGNSEAGDELAETAASLSKNIIEFGTMVEEAKISIETVKTQLQEQITNLDSDVESLEKSTSNNTLIITDLQSAKDSLEQADSSLFAISEALFAADQALEQTSLDNLNIALTEITSLVGNIPEGSTVAAQISQAKNDLETAKLDLEIAIEEGNAEADAKVSAAKEEMNENLQETQKDINDSLSNKADKKDIENVMKAEVTTDASGKTTISMIIEE